MNKYLYFFKNPREFICSILSRLTFIPDKVYLKIVFRLKVGMKLNLQEPKTFNEKLQWLKLNDKNEKYTNMVDKLEAKKIVAETIGEEYIIPIIGIFDKFEDIDFNSLPCKFVIKCTHDSGGYVIVNDKKNVNIKMIKKKINKSLKKNYYYRGREWPYKNIKPKIIIEELITDKDNKHLTDYKFMCFNGKCKIIFTCTERFEDGLKVTFFDTKWNKLPFERHYPRSKKIIKEPYNLKKMIKLAEKLSKGIPFVRVDFYESNNKIYFGELTFFPGSGFEEFNPLEWDYKIGEMIDLSKIK